MNRMKVRMALLCVAACLALGARAQIGEPRDEIAVGFNGGMSFNRVTFDPTIQQKMHTGPTFGLTFRYTCEKYFSAVCALQVELNYARLGWKESIEDGQNNPLPDRYERHMDYIQIPFMARLGWGREVRGLMGYLIAGPQVGFCFGEKSERSAEWTEVSPGVPDRPNGMYAQYSMPLERKFDYGITGGLGLELHTKIGHFMVEGRYYYGLSDLFGNSKSDVFSRSNNGTITAKVTYLFNVRADKTPRK